MAKTTTPVLPSCFRLYVEGVISDDADVKHRFTALFIETWRRLPADDIKTITEELQRGQTQQIGIQLRDIHPSLRRGPSGSASAQMIRSLEGFEIIYAGRYAQKLSDVACRCWIAHELAHIYLAIVDPSHGSCYESAEREVADLLVRRWGFSAEEVESFNVDVYFIENGIQLRK